MAKTRVDQLKLGDKIMPPPRELRLWMRRNAERRGLSDAALVLTVCEIHEGTPDKGGRWIWVSGDQTPEWTADYVDQTKIHPFKFQARPDTLWLMA